ncbi:TOBE domain-containing protein [Deinococcus aestuarii]|uniref:TOBE domain-containing protein n=1 Tax=Deinococcus aestuarii TaxID=2774531 RepID=UPI001C0BD5E4|nr:molybdopterin-binding protein [Deinococcus aestuarii]
MRISARNTLKGQVTSLKLGDVEAEVTLQIEGGAEITATITRASAERLGLAEGREAYAVVKASDVMVAVDDPGR